MRAPRIHRTSSPGRVLRRGIAMVEFALIAPLFLLLILGMTEAGHAFQVSGDLCSAVREGARTASMDLSEVTASNQTLNQKVTQDIRNFLTANGIPGDRVTITITHVGSSSTFNLSDEANYLKSFRITASVPYAQVSRLPADYLTGRTLTFSAVYRMGRSQVTN